MMYKISVIAVIGLLVFSCKNREDVHVGVNDTMQNVRSVKGQTLFNSRKHAFSDPARLDSFVVTVTGDSLLEANVRLEIFDYAGRSIYLDTFSSGYLLGYGVDYNNTQAEKEDYIRKRVEGFFDTDSFIFPAIASTDPLDGEHTENKKFWTELKANPQAIGFYYLLGKEDGRYIAYSKSLRKALLYYNCC
jgi:hypothetical protein